MNSSVRLTGWVLFGITGLIFGTCLAAGIGWWWSASAPATATASKSASSAPLLYKNFLLIQVDSTQNDKSTIQSIWLVRLPINRTAFEIFTLHPSIFNGRSGVPQEVLQPYVIGTMTNTIVFDRSNLSDYIDRLGGITVAAQPMHGANVWHYLDSADTNNPDDLAIRQATVAQSVLMKMVAINGRVDIDKLFAPNLTQSNSAELLPLLHFYYPMRADSFRVHLINPS